jgi:hypothetical protein
MFTESYGPSLLPVPEVQIGPQTRGELSYDETWCGTPKRSGKGLGVVPHIAVDGGIVRIMERRRGHIPEQQGSVDRRASVIAAGNYRPRHSVQGTMEDSILRTLHVISGIFVQQRRKDPIREHALRCVAYAGSAQPLAKRASVGAVVRLTIAQLLVAGRRNAESNPGRIASSTRAKTNANASRHQ